MASRGKRKKAKPKNPNPLFCAWLDQWANEAEDKGWKSARSYFMALSSLKKYPLRLEKGKDCKILVHFGDKICSMLDKRLAEHIASGGSVGGAERSDDDSSPTSVQTSKRVAKPGVPSTSTTAATAPKKRRTMSAGRQYVPALRSGPYAMIVTLYQYTQVDCRGEYLTKQGLTRLAQPLCDKSLTVPETGSFYTAFSSMSNLITKGLVDKYSSPARYRLTNEGVLLAQTLIAQSPAAGATTSQSSTSSETQQSRSGSKASSSRGGRKTKPAALTSIQDDIQPQSTSNETRPTSYANPNNVATRRAPVEPTRPVDTPSTSSSAAPKFTLKPHEYEVILIIDNRENFGLGAARQHILPALVTNRVNFDVRPLSVGDFVWVVKGKSGEKREAVLDYIIERKRLDDLSSSIADGRYKEQKMRMKQSRLRKPIYLVEYYKTQSNEKIKEDALHQAVMNTQIIDGFYVKRCDNIKDCIAYITLLHQQIIKLYQNKTIHVYSQDTLPEVTFDPTDAEMCHIAYSDFHSFGAKNKPPTVGDCWKRMLMCVPTLSLEKANKIVELYPSLTRLIEAYRGCNSDSERMKLLSSIKSGAAGRRFGDVLSRNVYTLFYTAQPLS